MGVTTYDAQLLALIPGFLPLKVKVQPGVRVTLLPRAVVYAEFIREAEDGSIVRGRFRLYDLKLEEDATLPSAAEFQQLVRDARKEAGLEGVTIPGPVVTLRERSRPDGKPPIIKLHRDRRGQA